jgi:hypothetical protein
MAIRPAPRLNERSAPLVVWLSVNAILIVRVRKLTIRIISLI